jgi:hypothetical protein
MKMNKKGINYIELIISFALFVGFVIMLFVYLNPVRQPNLTDVVIDSVQGNFEKNATITLTEIPFKVTTPGCITNNMASLLSTNFGDYDKEKMFVEDDFGNLAPSFDFVDGVLVMQTSSAQIYHIFYSNDTEFTKISKTSCSTSPTPVPIDVSTARSSSTLSFDRLNRLNDSYYNDYEGLKKQFDVPALGDFAIKIYNETTVFFDMTRNIPKGINVQAREYPISILDESTAKRAKAFVNIRVW